MIEGVAIKYLPILVVLLGALFPGTIHAQTAVGLTDGEPPPGQFVPIDGTRLWVESEGAG